MTLSEWLKIKQGDRSQEDFGEFLGISQSTISRVYSGKRGLGANVLKTLVATYPDEIDEIFGLFFASEYAKVTEPSTAGMEEPA